MIRNKSSQVRHLCTGIFLQGEVTGNVCSCVQVRLQVGAAAQQKIHVTLSSGISAAESQNVFTVPVHACADARGCNTAQKTWFYINKQINTANKL